MAVDTSTTISGFDTAKPASSDPKSEGDDNFRHIKSVLKTTFPNVAGATTVTHTQLSYVTGVTSAIQTQIDTKATVASPTFTGVPAAPTAATGTSTTQLATTAFAMGAVGSYASNAIGTYVMAKAGAAATIGDSIAGVNLQGAGITITPAQVGTGSGLSGTWRCMGHAPNGSDVSLFVRIA